MNEKSYRITNMKAFRGWLAGGGQGTFTITGKQGNQTIYGVPVRDGIVGLYKQTFLYRGARLCPVGIYGTESHVLVGTAWPLASAGVQIPAVRNEIAEAALQQCVWGIITGTLTGGGDAPDDRLYRDVLKTCIFEKSIKCGISETLKKKIAAGVSRLSTDDIAEEYAVNGEPACTRLADSVCRDVQDDIVPIVRVYEAMQSGTYGDAALRLAVKIVQEHLHNLKVCIQTDHVTAMADVDEQAAAVAMVDGQPVSTKNAWSVPFEKISAIKQVCRVWPTDEIHELVVYEAA